VRDRLEATNSLGDVDIVLVTFADTGQLDEYQRRRGLQFPILIDADRSVYAAYGLGRAPRRTVWGLASAKRYASILRSSGLRRWLDDLGSPGGDDTRQLGGDFVIAPNGRLTWGYWGTGPADRPSPDEIVNAVRHG
jgi:hypothetical protein